MIKEVDLRFDERNHNLHKFAYVCTGHHFLPAISSAFCLDSLLTRLSHPTSRCVVKSFLYKYTQHLVAQKKCAYHLNFE